MVVCRKPRINKLFEIFTALFEKKTNTHTNAIHSSPEDNYSESLTDAVQCVRCPTYWPRGGVAQCARAGFTGLNLYICFRCERDAS